MAPEVAFDLKAIRALCVEFGVSSLEVFGSASAGPFDPFDSDADFLVVFHEDDARRGFDHFAHLLVFEDRLAEILDRPVDVTSATTFRNPYFARTVKRSRRLLYGTAPAHPPIPGDVAMMDPTYERTLKLLEDIRFAARALVDESDGQTFDGLLQDLRYRLFVERSFEIVGEATRRLRDEDPAMFGRLPEGTKIVGTRTAFARMRLGHYDGVRYRRSTKNPPRGMTEPATIVRNVSGFQRSARHSRNAIATYAMNSTPWTGPSTSTPSGRSKAYFTTVATSSSRNEVASTSATHRSQLSGNGARRTGVGVLVVASMGPV